MVQRISKELTTELHNLRVSGSYGSIDDLAPGKNTNGVQISQKSPHGNSSLDRVAEKSQSRTPQHTAGHIKSWLRIQVQEQIPPQQLGNVILGHEKVVALLRQYRIYS